MFYRSRPTTWWTILLGLILFFTIPWWFLAFIGAIASAFGGNIFPILLLTLAGIWIITQF